jgi:hypothetical protein
VNDARSSRVFSAGGHTFTWNDVIEAARARGDWAVLQREVLGLLARERDLAAAKSLPSSTHVEAAAKDFRYRHNLLSADELEEWLARRDIGVEEWKSEMRRSLLEPASHSPAATPESAERAYWVHAVCSGKLAIYARTLAEEVAVHLSEQPLTLMADELVAFPQKRARYCAAQLRAGALAEVIRNNSVGWTRLDLRYLAHADETVVREAALCVRVDGRPLADVAEDAGAPLQESRILLDDAEPLLKPRLLAAADGELIGPYATESDHRLVHVVRRIPPTLDDPQVRRRAEDTIIRLALDAEVNRHVNWHDYL